MSIKTFYLSAPVICFLCCVTIPSVDALGMGAALPPSPGASRFPALLICDGEDGLSRYDWNGNSLLPVWEALDARDVQPQTDGSYLVTGGSSYVSLLKKKGSSYRAVWTWERMNLPCIVNAVAAAWEWKGGPSLILASDCTMNRIFLADARSDQPRIRWEFKLPVPPQRVSLCPDNGNYLVTLRAPATGLGETPQVAEVDRRESRVSWYLDSKNGIILAQDAVRDRRGRTMVVAGRKPELSCFDREKKLLWRSPLPNTPGASHALSLFDSSGKGMLLVCARPKVSARPGLSSGVYLVDPEDGKVRAFTRGISPGKSAPLNVVPDDAAFSRPGR